MDKLLQALSNVQTSLDRIYHFLGAPIPPRGGTEAQWAAWQAEMDERYGPQEEHCLDPDCDAARAIHKRQYRGLVEYDPNGAAESRQGEG